MITIYQITNLINGKSYIGQTGNSLPQRFSQHKTARRSIKLANAMSKYGDENFTIESICQTDNQADADSLEIFLIANRDTISGGYNIAPGGSRGKWSEESKQKLSMSMKGKNKTGHPWSDEQRRKYATTRTGSPTGLTEEGRKRMSDKAKARMTSERARAIGAKAIRGGRPLSEETKAKISEAQKQNSKHRERDAQGKFAELGAAARNA